MNVERRSAATPARRLRVVQWTTGNTGRAAVRGVVEHPLLELVGCYAWSADKVGRDAGELSGIAPVGVTATDDVAALLSLAPDCVVYTPHRADISHVERILESGCSVVTTMYKLAGTGLGGETHERIVDAAKRGGAALYASGIYPGHIPMLALAATAVCRRIDRITMLEAADLRRYPNEAMYRAMGIDRDPEDPEAAMLIEQACGSFRDQIAVMARALAVDLDEIRFRADFAVATADLDVGFMKIRAGRVAAIRGIIAGLRDGTSRIECRSIWTMGDATSPNWPCDRGYLIEVEGEPSFRCRIEPGTGWTGALSTAMPVVNAIPAVCAAPPGIVNFGELPLVRGVNRLD